MVWVGLTACDDEFVSGGGGAGGTSTGATTGTSAGTSNGSETGSETGTMSGTASGTAAGTDTGTDAGTPSGLAELLCPLEPCVAAAPLETPCEGPSGCLVKVCGYDPSCCVEAWSASCASAAVRLCGGSLCTDACSVLFSGLAGYVLCGSTTWSCNLLTTDSRSCAAICGLAGASCTSAGGLSECGGASTILSCEDDNPTSQSRNCRCNLSCEGDTGLCPPEQLCHGGDCVSSS